MWALPDPGDIVWCRFPERPRDQPGPKSRPALILAVAEYEHGVLVTVAYGTSQKITQLKAGEFVIRKLDNASAYMLAGLSFDTKFDLSHRLELPWSDLFFAVAPKANFGQHPKMGCLHISLSHALKAAMKAAAE